MRRIIIKIAWIFVLFFVLKTEYFSLSVLAASPDAPPSGLMAAAVCDINTFPYPGALITLTWNDNSDNELGFSVFRKSGETWESIALLGQDVISYSVEHRDVSLAEFRSESFKVSANFASNFPNSSNEVSVGVPSCGKISTHVNTTVSDVNGNVYTSSGDGAGNVFVNPAGTSCGSGCYLYEDLSSAVNISAFSDPSSQFIGWTGDASGTASPVTLNPYNYYSQNINADFQLLKNLSVSKAGFGSGTITGNPSGNEGDDIDCGSNCNAQFNQGVVVDLIATPNSGSSFSGWSGDADCSDGNVTMNNDKSCVATFDLNNYSLSVTKTGSGAGIITSDDGGINCGVNCFKFYNSSSAVILTAAPNPGSAFSGWSGDPDCSDGVVTMNANKTCEATFNVSISAEADIRANNSNSITVPYNSSVLIEWCGADAHVCANAASCKVGTSLGGSDIATSVSGSHTTPNLTSNTAYYLECVNNIGNISTDSVLVGVAYSLNIDKSGTGSGIVTSSPAGINCGSNCSYLYNSGEVVNLSPVSSQGSSFVSWSGDADCADGVVTMNASKSCTAEFRLAYSAEADIRANDASSVTVPAGSTVLIEWCGFDAHACAEAVSCKVGTALGGNDISTSISGAYNTPSLSSETTYYLECANSAGNVSYDSARIKMKYDLSVNKNGTGSGVVTSSPFGINCGLSCSYLYDNGAVVTLTPTPSSGATFSGWSGDLDCADGVVTMNANKTCTATFNLVSPAEADIRANNSTSATVNYNSSVLIEWCGSDAHACANAVSCKVGTFLGGSNVSPTAVSGAYTTPLLTSNTTYYLECVNSVGNVSYDSVLVRMRYNLNVSKIGTGSGTITTSPTRINCGSTCSGYFNSGANVDLIATPAAGSSFAGWSGDADCSDGRLSMNANKNCIATFNLISGGEPEVDIRANNANSLAVNYNSSVLIEWCGSDAHACANAVSCKVGTFLGGSNVSPTAVSGAYTTPLLTSNTTYYLECVNGVGNVSYDSVAVSIRYRLSIEKDGTGSGTVIAGNSINCGLTCSAYFNYGNVSLNAVPAAGSSFSGWSGDADCSDGVVTMNANKTCKATFSQSYNLTVNKSGTGTGNVFGDPPGFGGDDIDCGSNCVASFLPDTAVTLIQTPVAGSFFSGWSGDADCADGVVTMNANKTCEAIFIYDYPAEADIRANDSNSITVPYNSSVLIEWCGSDAHACANAVSCKVGASLGGSDIATSVSGAYTTPNLTSSMRYYLECENHVLDFSYNSVFVEIAYNLSVNKIGTGAGTVSSNPVGINCGANCVYDFTNGTSVGLTANPDAESTFSGWSGDADCADGIVTMDDNKNCTARFDRVLAEVDIRANGAISPNPLAPSITVSYNSPVLIEWCGSGSDAHACVNAVSCKVGTVFEGSDISDLSNISVSDIFGSYETPNLTTPGVVTYYIECDNIEGVTSNGSVSVRVDLPVLMASLAASQGSCCGDGCSSFNPLFAATRESGSTAIGDIKYEFDCNYDGNTINSNPASTITSYNTSESYECGPFAGDTTVAVRMTQPSLGGAQSDEDIATAIVSILNPSCDPTDQECEGVAYYKSCGDPIGNPSCVGTRSCKSGNWREVFP